MSVPAYEAPPPTSASATARVLAALMSELEETADEMERLILEEFPIYRRFDSPEAGNAWRDGLRATLALFVRLQREDRTLNGSEVAFIERIGESRADQGFPLDVVLGSVRLAMHAALAVVHRTTQRELAGVDHKGSDVFASLSLRMTQFINAFSSALSHGYFRQVEERVRAGERDRAAFVDDWLAGAYESDEELEQAAAAVGLDPTGGLGLALLPTSGPMSHFLVAKASTALDPVVVAPMASAAVPHAVLVLRAAGRAEWARVQAELESVVRDGGIPALVDGPFTSLGDVHARYVEAAAVLRLACDTGQRGVVSAPRLAALHLVANGAGTARAVVEREILAPLRRRPNAEKLLSCLRAMFEHGSAKAVANACNVDVRTVRARKREIEEATGRSFDHAGDVLWLGLAALATAADG